MLTFLVLVVPLTLTFLIVGYASRKGRIAYETRLLATATDAPSFHTPKTVRVKRQRGQRQGNHDDDLLLGLIAGWWFFGKH